MSDQHVEVRAVVWKEIFPWFLLPRAFSIAISPSVLICALLALLGSSAGWRAAAWLFVMEKDGDEYEMREDIKWTDVEDVEYLVAWPGRQHPNAAVLQQRLGFEDRDRQEDPVYSVVRRMAEPWWQLIRSPGISDEGGRTWREFAFYLSGGLWSLLVWSGFAGAITRAAALRMGREERIGLSDSLSFAKRRLGQYFAAPLLPLVGVLLLAILPALAGLLMRVSFFAAVLGYLWVFILLFGLVITLLLLGLLVGWPLMWPAISTEGRNGDSFDALSRSYGYAFGRPLNYFFYALVAAVIGILGWFVVCFVSEGVIELSYRATSLGSGGERMSEIQKAAVGDELDSTLLERGGEAVGWWVSVVRAFANAYAYSFFWCAATAIYLLLRRDIDQAEIESIESDGDEPPAPLPPLTTDSAGVAGAASKSPPGEGE